MPRSFAPVIARLTSVSERAIRTRFVPVCQVLSESCEPGCCDWEALPVLDFLDHAYRRTTPAR
jgi:hypothetical protein